MATGDLKNCGTRLQSLLRAAKYHNVVDYSALFFGVPQEFLPLLHFIFQEYSLPFTKYLLKKGHEMSGKSDKQFLDSVYKVLRDEFGYVPKLSKDRFFCNGYTEQKMIMTSNIYQFILDKCKGPRKTKCKVRSVNKENVAPKRSQSSSSVKSMDQHSVSSWVVEIPEMSHSRPSPFDPLDMPHSPMRSAPQPDTSPQPVNISSGMEESILQSDSALDITLTRTPSPPPVRIYSEAGARTVYALDHLKHEGDFGALDSTPKNVLGQVQVLSISESGQVPVKVCREVPETSLPPQPASFTACPCNHGRDIEEIKTILMTLSARLDILESKENHSQKIKKSALSSFENFDNNSIEEPKRKLHFRIPSSEGNEHGSTAESVDKLECSGQESFQSEAIETADVGSEDDIRDFLKSVHERLDTTRSFLRTYDVSGTS